MNSINWGIIGCGDVTEVKSGPAFQKVAHSSLVAVMRRDAGKAANYAKRHHVPNWFSDADQLINHPEVNAVYVATPPNFHAFYAKKAIEAGKPVYIEKPMCRTYEECVEVCELAEQKNVPVFVAYYRRKLSGFIKVKELLENGAIGDVRMVNIKLFKHANEKMNSAMPWRVDPSISGGGHFYDLASHQLDYLDFLFGEIIAVESIVANQAGLYSAEDILSISFLHQNGIVGSGSWCFNSSKVNDHDSVEIIGSKGRIEFSTFDFVPIKLITQKGIQSFEFEKPQHVQQAMIEHVVNCLLKNEKPVSDGFSGARTNKIMEQIVNNYYSK
ncbi:MAG TPA: Gfo/Idh/MocA family oxidoreductase [Prolixibacteraceae bacterium]|nr:Gfo/Idh/MocA family oxidoreductase [Prolixibacteraceae bacterium]